MADDSHLHLTRRERQIIEALHAHGELSVNDLQNHLPDPPTSMAIRNMLRIMDDKGLLKRRKVGREFLYRAKAVRGRAGRSAMQRVIQTFFDGSIEQALGAYFTGSRAKLTDAQRESLHRLIEEARKRGE